MQRSSLNRAILIGRLGKNPEGRYTPNGTSTARFSIATDESWVDSENNKQEHTEWHDVEAWGKTADFVTQYLQKGQLVCVEGKIRTQSWKDKEGNQRKKTEIVCQSVTPLEWKTDKKSNESTKDDSDVKKDIPF